MDNREQYALPLGRTGPQTCLLPAMSDATFQRIARLDNRVPSTLHPGTPVSLIATANNLIAMYSAPDLHSRVLGQYMQGTRLTIIRHPAYAEHPVPTTDHRWYYVETAEQTRGWISDRHLRLYSQ